MKSLFKSATLFVASLAVCFSMGSCTSTKPIDKTQLSGYWVLKTLDGENAKTAFEGSLPSIEFNFDLNQISGSAGCNRYFGGFTLDEKNNFSAEKLGSTLMACIQKNAEPKFLEVLGTPSIISIDKDGVLNFSQGKKVILQFEKGTDSSANTDVQSITAETLSGLWTLTMIVDGDLATLFPNKAATINFEGDGKVYGNGGCNSYRGTYTLNDNTITFGPLMSTKMACPGLDGETKFTNQLSTPVQVTINGETLTFSKNGNVVLEFTKTEKAE